MIPVLPKPSMKCSDFLMAILHIILYSMCCKTPCKLLDFGLHYPQPTT